MLETNLFLLIEGLKEITETASEEVLKLVDVEPLFGNRRAKTHWVTFMKK